MVRRSSLLGQGLYTVGPVSYIFSVTWFAGDFKEPTHYSIRVGDVVPSVVVYLVIYIVTHHGLGGLSGLINGLIAAARGAFVCRRPSPLQNKCKGVHV